MQAWFTPGRLVDLALACLALEACVLLVWHARTGRGLAPRWLLPNLAAGACLMLALRAASAGGSAFVIAAWLAAALVAHGLDLMRRWPV